MMNKKKRAKQSQRSIYIHDRYDCRDAEKRTGEQFE